MRYCIPILLLVVYTVNAQAQPPVTAKLLSFEEALLQTTTQNPQLKASGYAEEAALQEKKAAFGLRLPQVNVSATYSFLSDNISVDMNGLKAPVGAFLNGMAPSLPPQLNALGGALLKRNWQLVLQEDNFGMVGASAKMPIYMGGKINAANNAAKINLKESHEQGTQTQNALISELAERYFGLALAQQVIAVRRQVLEGMEHHLSDAQALENTGIIARAERLYAEMHVAEAKKELQKAIRDAQTINTALCNTLNATGEFNPVTAMFVVNKLEPLDHFKALVRQNNPLLKQVSLKEDLAKEGVRVQRAEFLPQVALMGGYDIYNHQLSKAVPRWAVGAGIQLKIFDGLNREHKYSAAKNTVLQVQALGEKATADLITLVEKTYNEILNNGEQILAIETSLVFAQEYLRIKEVAFKEGVGSSSEVVDARLNLAKIKTERLQAAYAYDQLLAQLLEVCGQSLDYNLYAAGERTPIHFEN